MSKWVNSQTKREQRAQRARRKAMVDAAFHLAFVVRENLPCAVKRQGCPTQQTIKLDRIRAALARLDEIQRAGNCQGQPMPDDPQFIGKFGSGSV